MPVMLCDGYLPLNFCLKLKNYIQYVQLQKKYFTVKFNTDQNWVDCIAAGSIGVGKICPLGKQHLEPSKVLVQ
jgi:hypothetical protein